MKVIVNVLDNSRAVFIMELLHSFSYVKVQPVTDEDVLLLNENEDNIVATLPFQKQIKQKTKDDIVISPFVMSIAAENPIPADYDYKADYRNHLSKKYA